MAPVIIAKDLYKCYAGFSPVLRGVNIEVEAGELVAIMGPSGCGKSTMLHVLGMLHAPDSGTLEILGTNVLEFNREQTAAFRRGNMGFVMQSSNMFDHSTVFENVEFPLIYENVPPAERWERVIRALELVRLSARVHYRSNRLSGGEQQRVAIARAIANHPKVLLLDEPLAALDLKLRKDMQKELKKIQQQLGITFVFVTHDQEEALTMSDRVVVMDSGKIQQVGTPQDIYNEPQNAFVADFIGESNILDGVMLRDLYVEFSGARFDCLDKGFAENEAVDVVVRPEDVDIVPPEKGMLTGTVTSVAFLGVHYEIIVDIGGFKWMIQTTDEHFVGDKVGLYIEPDAIHIMKKSKYSGLYGDYSSYSEEIDHLSDVIEEE